MMFNSLTTKWSGLILLLVFACILETQIGASNTTELITLALFALSLSGAVLIAVSNSRHRLVFLLLGTLWYVTSAATILEAPLRSISTLLTLIIMFLALYGTFKYMITAKINDIEVLLAAVYGYLLLTMSWAILYMQIEKWVPGSFSLSEGADAWSAFLYFSIVTMTTLGYGDVLPVGPEARLAAGFEAIVGVLYIAVLIGSIVGGFASSKEQNKTK